ncbi:hypothetical protein N9934_03475 [Desulfosarcina sp.]|nr:hypothetical protein [Desulfosarcina sp.]
MKSTFYENGYYQFLWNSENNTANIVNNGLHPGIHYIEGNLEALKRISQ